MIRDTFFSMNRFVALCRKEMVESWKVNLLRSIMVYGVLAIAFVWNGYFQYIGLNAHAQVSNDPIWRFELNFFIFGLVFLGCLSGSFLMERMKTKTSRTAVLMTPATMFEKYISRWLVYTFCFIIIYLIAYKLADWTRVIVYTLSFPDVKGIASVPLSYFIKGTESFSPLFDKGSECLMAISAYFFLQSCFVLGSSIWPKNSFIKTFAACAGIIIVYILVGLTLAKILFTRDYVEPFGLTDDQGMDYSIIGFALGALFNWVLAYFRFKESEIINRW